jgi:hypothetical protein
MTRPSGPHLSPDDIDAWLAGTLAPDAQAHLDHCPECLEVLRAEREVVDLLAALPYPSPAPHFADRVMARVMVADPFALRSLRTARRRLLATRKSLAVAAALTVALVGSVAASVAWTLTHQQMLTALGGWLLSEAGQLAWIALRGAASNLIEQPWYAALKTFLGSPVRLALASALASLTYLGGIFALRRLLALPAPQVAHANL